MPAIWRESPPRNPNGSHCRAIKPLTSVDPVDLDSRCARLESSCSVGVGRLSPESRNLMNDTPSADLPPVAVAHAAREAEVMASLSKLLPRHAILSRPEDIV